MFQGEAHLTVLSRSDLEDVLAFVSSLGKFESVADMREHLLPELRRLIPADSATYTEIKPLSGEATWWTDPRSVGESANEGAFVEFLDQHPVGNFHARVDGRAVQLADFLSRRELHRLDLYNEFYRPLEVEHQIAIAVDAPGPLVIPISLQRKDRPFPERARELLDLLRPHLEHAYETLHARARWRRALEAMDEATTKGGPAALVLGAQGTIELETGPGRRWLEEYFGPAARHADRLPGDLWAWLGERRAGSPKPDPRLVVRRPGRRLEVRHLPAQAAGEPEALLLEEHQERLDPDEPRRAGLTTRESEVLACAATGRTNREIALELCISPRTVQKHLANICRKLGVTTRTAAVAEGFGLEQGLVR